MIVCPAVPVAVPAMFSQKPVRVSGPTRSVAMTNGICSTIAAAQPTKPAQIISRKARPSRVRVSRIERRIASRPPIGSSTTAGIATA